MDKLIIINIEKLFWEKDIFSFLSIKQIAKKVHSNKTSTSINKTYIKEHVQEILNKLEYNDHGYLLIKDKENTCIQIYKNNIL